MENKLFLIGNSHIDPVWLWRWQEGFSEILATFRSALDRMKDFEDFKFTSACCMYYELVEKLDPDMFEEIKMRVKEGRWNIVGGWFLQPDCNIPDGESYARHALVSQRYFKEKFGITVKTGYNVDSFGHNAALPKILSASVMENYVFGRPSVKEQGYSHLVFEWKSNDGSSVTAYRIPDVYNNDVNGIHNIENVIKKIEEDDISLMSFYGVGNHGGGPTIKLIEELRNLKFEKKIFATPDEYFMALNKDELPVFEGELQHHARGCYSACSVVKTSNRKCEQNLIAAEKICTMASELTDYIYPQKKLNKAWKNLMFNQFHDILGGCSVKKAYDDAEYLFGEIMSITEQEMYFAMKKIAMNIDTLCGETLPAFKKPQNFKIWQHEVLGTPIVVFNPHSHAVRECICVNAIAKKITDYNGNEIDFQLIRSDHTNWADIYHTIFNVEIPPLGYVTYRLFVEQESTKNFTNKLSVTEKSLENSAIRVEFNSETGDIEKIYDKTNGTYILDGKCKAVLLDETAYDTWAHDTDSLGETVGCFGKPEFTITEKGPVRATIRIKSKYNNSVLQREYSIIPDDKRVFVKTKVDFHEEHRTLKFTFPMHEETVVAKIPYGTVTRRGYTGEEPCGSWIASGPLVVANDSKYGYDTENGEMRMTVLRSAIYAERTIERDEFCEVMEQGVHEFSYCIYPFVSCSAAEKYAQNLNFAPVHIKESFHEGNLPEKMCCFESDNENIIVTAIKKAEESDSKIIRVCEMEGESSSSKIKFFDKEVVIDIASNSITTCTEDGKKLNLIEW